MIDQIADAIAVHLKVNVPSISKAGGIAQVVTLSSAGTPLRLPACMIGGGPGYTGMLPDSLESAVLFFQVVSNSTRPEAPGGRIDMDTTLRLVLWVNQTKIYPVDVDAVLRDVLYRLASFHFDETGDGKPKAVKVFSASYEPKNKEIFNPYTFDESQTQFLTPPYDWRSIQVRVLYSITRQCSPGWVTAQDHC